MDRLEHRGWRWAQQGLGIRLIGLLLLVCLGLGVACSGSEDSSVGVVPPVPAPTPVPPTAEPGTLVVPMPVRQIGSLKLLGLPMTVAGGGSELLLDTGSAGVRVLASAAGTQGLQVTNTPDQVFFADGTIFDGVVAIAPVSIGTAATTAPLTIQLITEVRCQGGGDDCSKDLFDGTGFFSGIVGVSLLGRSSNDDLFSPVPQLSGNLASGYLIRTGGFNSSQGTFTLGLTDNNTAGAGVGSFTQVGTFPNGTPVWNDEQPVIYTITDAVGSVVINQQVSDTVFDTGSSDIFLDTIALGSSIFLTNQLLPGSEFLSVLPGGFTYGFTVTSPVTPGDDRVFVDSLNGFQVLGMPFFFTFDVFFDINQGRIGFFR